MNATAARRTFIIDYLSPERGYCIDVQTGLDLFEAISGFMRLRPLKSVRSIRQVGA